tara:strand:+ start:1377 stop:6041 length:4665 start_codon:yes stop_codon:yes gene_type:complete
MPTIREIIQAKKDKELDTVDNKQSIREIIQAKKDKVLNTISKKQPQDLETEKKKDTNWFKAGAAGLASGIIKMEEGVVSLGAELIDMGLGTNNAAKVEKFFDKINIYEDTAHDRTIGHLTELFTQIGIPGGIGFKMGTKMANKAIAAKRAGKYADIPLKTSDAFKKLGLQSAGTGLGETTVADTGELGWFGESVEEKEGRARAATSLANRLKFGTEGAAFTGVLGGTGRLGKHILTRKIGESTKPMDKILDKVSAGLRSKGGETTAQFGLRKQAEREIKAVQTKIGHTVERLNYTSNKFNFATKNTVPHQTPATQEKYYTQLFDVMTGGFARVPIKEIPRKIKPIIKEPKALWKLPKEQKIPSGKTSRPQIPYGAKKGIKWEKGSINLDIGGGRYDQFTNFLSKKGVKNLIYDPFTRSVSHNKNVARRVAGGRANTATLFNTLNTIKESKYQIKALRQAKDALKSDGKLYVSVHEGSKTGIGRITKDGFQHNKKIEKYLPLIRKVFGKNNVEISTIGGKKMLVATRSIRKGAPDLVKKITRRKTPKTSILNSKTDAVKNLNKTLDELKVTSDQRTEINLALTDGRNIIDDLSNEFINMRSVTRKDKRKLLGELGGVIKANLGKYLTRNYKLYATNKSILPFMRWKPAQEVIQKAKDYLKDYKVQLELEKEGLLIGPKRKGKLVKLEDKEVNDLVNRLVEEGGFKKRGVSGKPDLRFLSYDEKVLRKRKHIPPALRDLLGEVKDPRYNMLSTVNKLSSIVHNHNYLNELYTLGRKPANKFVFHPNEAGRPDNFVKLELKTELSNPLHGKYIPEFLEKALQDSLTTQKKNMTIRAYEAMLVYPKALSQAAKTIFSGVTHIRNFVSAGAFAAANGNLLNPQNYKGAGKLAFGPALSDSLFGAKPFTKEALRQYNELQRLGVINTSVKASELKALMNDLNWKDIANNNISGFQGMFRPFAKLKSGLEKLYFAEDDFWKIVNYQGEYNKLLNAKRLFEPTKYTKLTSNLQKEIMEESAEIVRNTVPNYDFVAPWIKGIRYLPVGNFVSFPAEIIRTSKNIMKQAIREMNSNNPYIRSIGEKRLMGFTATVGALPPAIVATYKTLHGVTENEMQALHQIVAPYEEHNVLVPMGKSENGDFQYMDLSYSLAYDVISQPAKILMNKVAQGVRDEATLSETLNGAIFESVKHLSEPFVGESIWTKAYMDIVHRGGRTRDGKVIYREGDPNIELKILNHLLVEPFVPGSTQQYGRVSRGILGMPGKYGEDLKLKNELPGLAGFRIKSIEPKISIPFAAKDFSSKKRQADSIFGGNMFKFKFLNFGKYDSDDIVEDYEAMQKQRFDVFRDAHRNIKAYKTLGASQYQITNGLRKLSDTDQGILNSGIYQPSIPTDSKAMEFSILAEEYGIPNPWYDAYDQITRIASTADSVPLDGPNPFVRQRIDKDTGETKYGPYMRLPDTDKSKTIRDIIDEKRNAQQKKGIMNRIRNFGFGRQQPPTPQQQPQIPDQGAGAGPTPPPPNTQGSISQNPAMYKALYPNDPLAQAIVEGRAGPRGYKRGGLVKK